ncbi:MAG TPA: TonB-dependent receptor [Acidobacteriota bacterium]|jgi:outer membrane cobalamin receptor
MRRTPLLLILTAGISRCFAQTTPANEPKPQIEPTVITVSAQSLPLSQVSASVTVLTREQIEQSRAENLTEVLRQLPFLHISQTGGRGGLTTVTLRGGDPNFTLVMIDGVPVNDITNLLGGSYDFSSLSTDNIEQIEIVRGPLSARFGSQAISGVINIISRRGKGKPTFEADGSAGNFSDGSVRAGSHGELKGWDFAFGSSYQRNGEQTLLDRFSLGTVSFNSGLKLGKGKSLHFSTRFDENHVSGFPEASGGPEFSILKEAKSSHAAEVALALEYLQQIRPWWLYTLEFGFFDRSQDSFTPAILDAVKPTRRSQPSFQNETDFDRALFRFTNTWTLPRRWSGVFAVEASNESGKSRTLIAARFPSNFTLDRTTSALLAELLYRSNRLQMSFGMRRDAAERFAAEYTPRLGVSYRLNDHGTRFRASWGEGFKIPSFFALGEPTVGNPKLRPERSRSFDVGVEQSVLSRLQASFTYFHSSFRDLIDFSPQEFRLLNRSLAITQGVEFETSARVSEQWKVAGHVSFLNAELVDSDEPLRDRPRWRGGVNVDWDARRAHLRAETLWVGPRFDFQIPVPNLQIAGGYSTTNVSLSCRLSDELTPYIRVENLWNRKFHEFIGFPNPGRFFRAGVQYRF